MKHNIFLLLVVVVVVSLIITAIVPWPYSLLVNALAGGAIGYTAQRAGLV